jgi:heavy metal sensor kinase
MSTWRVRDERFELTGATWWSRAPIRVRLTILYSSVLVLMLVVYATATYLAVRHEFLEQSEERLHEGLSEAARAEHADTQVQEQLGEVLMVLALGFPLVVAMAALGGYVLARRALTPIDHLASEARRISADRLHERLTVPNSRDEIGRLAGVINDTLARLESSFDQLRRFTADASHELRTPLAVIRGIGETGLQRERTASDYKEAIGSMLEEVDRLTTLVDTLLRLSHGDAGTVKLAKTAVDFGQLTRDVVSSLAILAEERGQRLDIEAASGLSVMADRLVLREAITNVVDNAIKYSPRDSCINVRVDAHGKRVILSVTDSGPGIPAEYRDRIFDRFFRIDEARSRELGGSGLGLAIARWAVAANGGQITVDASPNGGSVFRIVLPRSESAQSNAAE